MRKFLVQINLLLACLLLSSCGSKVSPTALADELIAKYEEMVSALEAVKDTGSAKAAAEKIDALGDELLEVAAKVEDLDEVTDEMRQRNYREFMAVMDRLVAAESQYGPKIADDKEALTVLIKALDGFEAKEARLQGVYLQLGMRVE